jgi:hypothetical protein
MLYVIRGIKGLFIMGIYGEKGMLRNVLGRN